MGFIVPKARRNPYVQRTHSCSKNVVIGKQPLRSGNVEFENYEWTYDTLGTKYAIYMKIHRCNYFLNLYN